MGSENQELLALMEKCGHFLYHRRGGKRGQGKILKILLTEGEMTQKELQQRLGIQSGSMSEIVLKLEGNGLICRMRDETDKRKIKLSITKAGEELFKENHKMNIEQEKSLFDALIVEEQSQLGSLLSKLYDSWENSFDKSLFDHRKGGKKERED